MIHWRTLAFGLGLAANDIFMMPFVKHIVNGWPFSWIVIPMLAYSMNPIIFYFAMKAESMAIMNMVWNLTSNVVVTLVGLFLFKEVITTTKAFGILLSFIALFFMTYEGDGWLKGEKLKT
jgi:multidrug transporter EmrE-like cation transporter